MDLSQFSKPDIVIGCFLLFCGLLGFWKGAVRQFFSILAFVIALAASFLVPCFVKFPVSGGNSSLGGQVILSILIWIPVFLITNYLGRFITGKIIGKGISLGDRFWGFLFGGIKGLIIVTIFIFLLGIMPPSVQEAFPLVPRILEESRIAEAIEPFNPLFKLQIIKNLQAIIYATKDSEYWEEYEQEQGFRELMKQESIKEIVEDPELKEAIEKRQFIKFITNPKVRKLIGDQEAMKLLLNTELDNDQ